MAKKTKTDPFILSARRKQRKSLSNELEKAQNAAANAARYALARSVDRVDATAAKHDAVVYATASLGMAVVNSTGIKPPLKVSTGYGGTKAMTDHRKIVLTIDPRQYNPNDIDSMGRLVQFTKGLLYHEAGHILYSVPLPQMCRQVHGDVTTGNVANNANLTIKEFHSAWNILEDQRMESMMVQMSPIMRSYFTVIVLDYVVNVPVTAWAWVAGRTYLPKDVRRMLRSAFANYWAQFMPDALSKIDSIVAQYKRSSDASEMLECVIQFAHLLRDMRKWSTVPENFDSDEGHSMAPSFSEESPEDTNKRLAQTASADEGSDESDDEQQDDNPAAGKASDADEVADEDDSTDNAEASDSDDGEDADDEGAGEDISEPTPSPSTGSNATPSKSDESLGTGDEVPTPQDIKNAVDKAIDEILDRPDIQQEAKNFIASVNEELGSDLPHNPDTMIMSDVDMADADEVYKGMMGALEPLATSADPAWQFRQEQGVIDPTAYTLREPGDTDFWINREDTGATGFDLAVSIILDASGSMGSGRMRNVGVSAYAIRKACDSLDIPCTVTTFHTISQMLWAADEPLTEVYALDVGNTNPEGALTALRDQRFGKSRHLVVVLTDGIWSETDRLPHYSEPGRYFLVVGIGVNKYQLDALGADMVVSTYNVETLPELVTQALTGYLA